MRTKQVLLVTEPFSERNAGLIVIFGSSHPPCFSGKTGHAAVGVCQRDLDEVVSAQAMQLEDLFFARMGEFFSRTLGEGELHPCPWCQSGDGPGSEIHSC